MILLISDENDTMTDEICSWLLYQNKEFVRLNGNQHITKILFDFKRMSLEFLYMMLNII